jgi:hypothetical protein
VESHRRSYARDGLRLHCYFRNAVHGECERQKPSQSSKWTTRKLAALCLPAGILVAASERTDTGPTEFALGTARRGITRMAMSAAGTAMFAA